MAFQSKKSFPEHTHTKHQPSTGDAEPTHIRSSQRVGAGHCDSADRMDHPFGEEPPNVESGEGMGNRSSEGSGLFPEKA